MRYFPLTLAFAGWTFAAIAQPLASATPLASAEPAVAVAPANALAAAKPGEPKNITILPIPVLFYQPETGLGYGLGGLLSGRFGQDTAGTRPSNVRVQYWTTQKSQSLLQLVHTVFTPGEQYFLTGEITSYNLRLNYYGVGNDTRQGNESELNYRLFILNQRVQKQLGNKLFVGLQYRYTNTRNISFDQRADDGQPNYFGIDPRVSERERQRTIVSGIGPAITLDTRDNASTTFTGNYVDLGLTFNGKYLGSDYNFVRYQLDARHFQPLGSTRSILALQYLGQFHSGAVPFRELAGFGANLGGTLYNNANLMRGVFEQRYRDRQMMMFQAELRQKLFWRLDGAVFGGIGQVGERLNDFTFGGTRAAGGFGVRFNFIRRDRVNLRFDYAVGPGGSSGLYFAIGEAF